MVWTGAHGLATLASALAIVESRVCCRIHQQKGFDFIGFGVCFFFFCQRVCFQAAENLLSNRQPGVFLLRFSERAAGTFAVAYVKKSRSTGECSVKHYLLRPGDVAPPQRTLADFLGGQAYFVWVKKKKKL